MPRISLTNVMRGLKLPFSKASQVQLHPLKALIAATACCLPSFVSAAGYTNVYSNASFGWLDQYSLTNAPNGNIGPQACVPTASVNALTYLQLTGNLTNLTGTNYASWMDAAYTLSGSDYMNTSPTSGSFIRTLPSSLDKYVRDYKGFTNVQFAGMFSTDMTWNTSYPKPDYIDIAYPTTSFLTNALTLNSAILVSVLYSLGGAHELAVSGLQWDDKNANDIMDWGEASLLFVDPLDPSANYADTDVTGPAKFISGDVWWDTNTERLKMDYKQGSGGIPPYSTNDVTDLTIYTAMTMTVPEPSTYALLVMSAAGALWMWRRRA